MPSNDLLDDYFSSLNPEWVPDTPTDNGIPVTVVPVPKLYEDSLFGAYRGVRLDQGTPNWLQLPLYSQQTGAPIKIEIGGYSTAPSVDVRYREASGYDNRIYVPDDGDVAYLNSDGKSVVLPVPLEVKNQPGVYSVQVRVVDANAVERNRSAFTAVIDRGLWLADGTTPDDKGPATFDEIRTAIRDHPGANRLLQNFEYFLGETAQAIVGAVQMYCTTSPIGGRNFTTITWPPQWRRPMIDGCLAFLFETAATYFRRGHLPYNASGLAIDDLNKFEDYEKAAMKYRDRYEKWCELRKTEQSISAGWGSVSSGFPGYGPNSSW